jgi:hypothetical protein
MKPYGQLLNISSKFSELDPAQDRELTAQTLTSAIGRARSSGRTALAHRLESWWLRSVSATPEAFDVDSENVATREVGAGRLPQLTRRAW